jgi:hypothetical protein
LFIPELRVSVIEPSVPIEDAVTGVIANVLAVPAAMQVLFTVTLIFPFEAPHEKLYITEFVPAPDTSEAPAGADQL